MLPATSGSDSSKADDKAESSRQYKELLALDYGTVIPDPEELDTAPWLAKSDGLQFWPPYMVQNIKAII